MRDTRTGARALAVAVVASLVVLSAFAPLAAAAGGTTVSVVPADDRIETGETTTIQVVVDSADGGAGAAEFRVAVDDANTVRIVDVTVAGSGQVKETTADDGSWIDVEYAFADTADTGSVVVAEVTVEGVSAGTTGVTLEPAEGNDATVVYDENGHGYDVTGTNGVRLTVGDDDDGGSVSRASTGSDQSEQPTGERDGTDSDGESDTGGDVERVDETPPTESEDGDVSSGSDSDGASSGSGGETAASNDATATTPEPSIDVGTSTRFGIGWDTATIDRGVDAAGGPAVVAIGAAGVVGLIALGLRRRR
jgi:hypothetical protein